MRNFLEWIMRSNKKDNTVEKRTIKIKPTNIPKFIIPLSVMNTTKRALRVAGRNGVEGLVFWSGVIGEGDVAFIKRAIVPSRLMASRVHATITEKDLNEIYCTLRSHNEFLLAQVHSHPGAAFHSDTDDENAISFKKGFISIVVPFFGQVPFADLSQCKVYEYDGGQIWKALSRNEQTSRFKIVN
ncbi:hypothetical protein CU633_21955 [Bacillus sp. V3-13]|uniref:Mov34/MPN/PAD-1 family protein n=1 Tax=Bacillus sp. V3-13 TaxID=2053728 RepID=UPI000C77715F|nr:Mov34/MPN/PAD-1 family protein [Bacillus sp. V3-13]PLR75276.1 hypothetical protein CU633_21955 [Bacillus sp. V3-13]